MKQRGFSVIEILVVMVLISLLTLISIPTFAGSMKKTKDAERQVFVRELHRSLLSWKIGTKNVDFRLGQTSLAGISDQIKEELLKTGYRAEDIRPKEGIYYYYFINTDDIVNNPAHQFFVFACKQDELGSVSGLASEIAHVAGTKIPTEGVNDVGISDLNARTVCADNPIDIDNNVHVAPGWTAVKIEE